VVRLFIASHNNVSHFAEESQFHYFALQAGVKYAVRVSTTAHSVRPVSASCRLCLCFEAYRISRTVPLTTLAHTGQSNPC
jgi:hypothetical protein